MNNPNLVKTILPIFVIVVLIILAIPLVDRSHNAIGRGAGDPQNKAIQDRFTDTDDEDETLIIISQRRQREIFNLPPQEQNNPQQANILQPTAVPTPTRTPAPKATMTATKKPTTTPTKKATVVIKPPIAKTPTPIPPIKKQIL
jgi:hypothetical protein